jgi:hypothetical protein
MDRLHLRTSINDSGDEWLLFLAGSVRGGSWPASADSRGWRARSPEKGEAAAAHRLAAPLFTCAWSQRPTRAVGHEDAKQDEERLGVLDLWCGGGCSNVLGGWRLLDALGYLHQRR